MSKSINSEQQPDIEYIWLDLHSELSQFIKSKVPDESIAEDLLQDVFIKIHLNLHTLKKTEKLTSWIYQITRNTINDFYKNQRRPDHDTITLMASSDSEETLYVSLSNCINSKIENLAFNEREALLLTYFQNYNQKQLAEFLNISYSGAKNRVQRVRKKIEKAILACPNVEVTSTGELRRYNF